MSGPRLESTKAGPAAALARLDQTKVVCYSAHAVRSPQLGGNMQTVNMLEAKSSLSKLVAAIESGAETEVILARNGRPVARIVPLSAATSGVRIGIAKGQFAVPAGLDRQDPEMVILFDEGT